MPTDTAPLALMLTDTLQMQSVTVMSTRRPRLFSVSVKSDGRLNCIIATERQLAQLRDELDRAIDRARTIDRQEVTA